MLLLFPLRAILVSFSRCSNLFFALFYSPFRVTLLSSSHCSALLTLLGFPPHVVGFSSLCCSTFSGSPLQCCSPLPTAWLSKLLSYFMYKFFVLLFSFPRCCYWCVVIRWNLLYYPLHSFLEELGVVRSQEFKNLYFFNKFFPFVYFHFFF